VADQVAVMHDGRIVEEGPARSLFTSPQHPYTRQLLGSVLPVRGAAAS
jgi:peptide/nickel transport system ATP-binding protein